MSVLVAEDKNGNKFYTYELEKEPENISGNESSKSLLNNSVQQEDFVVNLFID